MCHSAQAFDRDGVPFRLVVEEPEVDAYAERFGRDRLLVLPHVDRGLFMARNWIMEHAIAEGHERHWQWDDNIRGVMRRFRAQRLYCDSGPALAACEDFTDRYENIGISGMNYHGLIKDRHKFMPFFLNVHVYSATLINNSIKQRWRHLYNDDTDLCLQVLAAGLCTVLFNVFLAMKMHTMTVKGGNTDDLYQGDGRLRMARSLERAWPRVVTTGRRFKRPQHLIRYDWKKFTTPLIRRKDVDFSALPPVDNYGLELRQVAPEVKSDFLRGLLAEQNG